MRLARAAIDEAGGKGVLGDHGAPATVDELLPEGGGRLGGGGGLFGGDVGRVRVVDALDDDDGAAEEQGEQGRDDHAVGIVDAGGEQVEEEAEALEHEADLTKEIGLRVEGLAAAEVGVAAQREHVRGQVDDDGDLDVGRGMAGLDVEDAGPRCAWKSRARTGW